MTMDWLADEIMPIERFEERNKTCCKFCSKTIYWIFTWQLGKWMAYEIENRKLHPRCIEKSNPRIWKYRK